MKTLIFRRSDKIPVRYEARSTATKEAAACIESIIKNPSFRGVVRLPRLERGSIGATQQVLLRPPLPFRLQSDIKRKSSTPAPK